jgi:hypothetical protein
MSFDNATPRPWAVHPKAPNEVVDTNGYLIFEVPSGYTEEDARDASADAALIVAAVNTYNPDREALIADLVGALANLTDAFLSMHGCFPLDRVTEEQRQWNDAMKEAYRLVGQPNTPAREIALTRARSTP